jgi:2-hydroxy-6-oxonona-2,4-dienedioate hydrolase
MERRGMEAPRYRVAEQRLWASVGASPDERTITLMRLGVEVRIQELGEGEPVLFIHGGPNSGSTWAGVAAKMTGYRSLLIDRPGTGLSAAARIGPGNLGEVAERFVADVLDGMGLGWAHVVGSSFGGFLALRSAAAAPERFGRMVQMGCPAGAPGIGMPGFMKAMVTPGVGRLIAALPPAERSARMIFGQIGHGRSLDAGYIPQAFFDWYLALQRHTDTMANESQLIRGLASVRAGWHPALSLDEDLLGRVTTPTHFFWGADDPFGGYDVARQLVGSMPAAELAMVPEAGHLPWLDDPTGAAEAIRSFLQPTVATDQVAG